MKNIIIAIFLVVMFAGGALICAALYFTVTFGALGWLFGTSSTRLGDAIGVVSGALGPPVGVALFFMIFWDRLLRDDGSPDRVAQAVALLVALPLVLIPLFSLGLKALDAVTTYKVPGVFATVGFLGLVGWVEKMTARNS